MVILTGVRRANVARSVRAGAGASVQQAITGMSVMSGGHNDGDALCTPTRDACGGGTCCAGTPTHRAGSCGVQAAHYVQGTVVPSRGPDGGFILIAARGRPVAGTMPHGGACDGSLQLVVRHSLGAWWSPCKEEQGGKAHPHPTRSLRTKATRVGKRPPLVTTAGMPRRGTDGQPRVLPDDNLEQRGGFWGGAGLALSRCLVCLSGLIHRSYGCGGGRAQAQSTREEVKPAMGNALVKTAMLASATALLSQHVRAPHSWHPNAHHRAGPPLPKARQVTV